MQSTRRSSLRDQALSVLAFILLSSATSLGQQAARPERGAMPHHTYSLTDIEAISLQNGNVNLSIPLASLPPIAGGELSWTVSATYNSKLWNVLRYQGEDTTDLQWNPYVVDTPGFDGGWRIGGRYTMVFRNSNEDFFRIFYPPNSGLSPSELNLLNNFSYWKMVLVMPDGSEHEFRPVDHSSYSGTQDFLRGYFNVLPNGSAVRYYSVDGTYMFARISGQSDWTVYMPDGTRIIQTPDGVQRIQDTNDNKIKIFSDTNGDHYQDEQTGREIRVTYDPAANGGQGQWRVWYSTVTGIQHRIDMNMGKTSVQGKTYLVEGWASQGGEEGGFICLHNKILSMQVPVVREIVFPQTEPTQPQRRFTFSYNADTTESASHPVRWSCNSGFTTYDRQASRGWGELSRMVTPSGSIVDYSYELDSQHILLGPADDLSRQSITEKKVTHDGIVDTWDYSISEIAASILSPDGNNVTETKYCTTAGCATGKAGLVYRTTAPFVMTERHWTNLTFSGANTASPGGVLTFNPVVDFEYTTLLDAGNNPLKMSARAFQYDFNGNLTQTTEYDWFDHTLVSRDAQGVPTGVPASATVLRITNNSHYNQAASASSANVYAKRSASTGAPLIINAVQQITTGPGIIQFSYDGQAYGVAPTIGNLTTRKAWVNLDNKWITTSNTYGLYGNVATSTDARGKVTQFFYDDATHALPTRVVVDPQNGTGTQTTTTAYDFSTGLVTSQTDVNGQITSVDYTNQLLNAIDPFGRPGITRSPTINVGGVNHRQRTTTTYLDSSRQQIVETDLNAENDKLLKTRTTVDMLGRPILNESTEGGTNYTISVRSAYLNMGQVTLTSTPMRSTAASTDSWTRVTKDGAGRVTELATFGGAAQPAWTGTAGAFTGAVTTSYTANFTTVTDQAGKVRRSMTDALGRLIRVDEPDTGGNLGSTASPTQPTSYSYDVFANLTTVTQGSQSRTFTYDSLSRLRTAVNPESGTIAYQYDDGGNLLVKTDARGVSTHYDYDALSRVTRRWYNGSSLVSATTHNSPILPSGVGATSEARFFYDSQSLPGGAPSYSRGSATGRLVAHIYGSGTNGDYYAYDVLGRPTLKIQQTGAVNYQLSAGYTLAGAVKSLMYPSGHTVTNTYDLAGRLSSFSGNLGDGTTRTYSTPLVYSPLQNVLKEQFATNTPVYHKIHYNSRSQLCDVRASAVNDEWGGELGALVNYYSSNWVHCGNGPDNNGNVLMSQTIINSYYMEDRYSYDALNRLTAVDEYENGTTHTGSQQYDYDRYGNRTIKPASWGTGINTKQFTVNTANNRLGVPAGQAGVMTYDVAGNLTNDTYTGAGNRTYDAENKITSAWGGNNQAQLYAYDASGQRIRRTVDGAETWQVYGFGGELLAEYAANGAATSPQKEYGYRNGELLITATPGSDQSLGLNGTSAYAQAPNSTSLNITGAITVEAWIKPNAIGSYQYIASRETYGVVGTGGGYELTLNNLGKARFDLYHSHNTYTPVIGNTVLTTGVWHHLAGVWDGTQMRLYVNGVLDATVTTGNGPASGNSNVKLGRNSGGGYFNGLIDEVRVSNAAIYTGNFTPQAHLSAAGSTKGLWKFDGSTASDSSGNGNHGALQSGATYSSDVPTGPAYHSGSFNGSSAYVQAPNSSSLNITGAITVEAWIKPNAIGSYQYIASRETYGVVGTGGGYELTLNNVGKARFDLYHSHNTYTPVIGNTVLTTGAWHHLAGVWDGAYLRLYVNGVLDATVTTGNGPASGTSSLKLGRNSGGGYFNGLIDEVRVSNAAVYTGNFTPQTHLSAAGSTKGLWKFDGQSTADASGNSNHGTLQGGAAYSNDVPSGDGGGGTSSAAQINWLVADHLGTPRMIIDQTGTLANIKRHDYLPFGEELFAPAGGRSAAMGYTNGDGVRQQFTLKERDNETGLDYFEARYYGSTAGRFMSVDPLAGYTEDPQTLNRYVYTRNNPLKYVDPDGLDFWIMGQGDYCKENGRCDKDGYVVDAKGDRVTVTNAQIRNRADSICFTCEQGEYTANVNEAGVQITNSQGQTFTGTFTENTVTLFGTDKLKDFTFNITGSSLKDGVLASGTFSHYGTSEETKQILSERGAFSYATDPLNKGHGDSTQFRFAKLPKLLLGITNNIDAIRLQTSNFGPSSHLSVANRPKSNVPKTTGEWHVDNSTGLSHLGCVAIGVGCQ